MKNLFHKLLSCFFKEPKVVNHSEVFVLLDQYEDHTETPKKKFKGPHYED